MLRMSRLADYATVVMARLARDPQRVQSATEIAAHVGVASPTVSKVLKMLARHQLVMSVRGARGGYRLARSCAEISVAEIIDSVDGRSALTECGTAPGLCEYEKRCSVRGNWQSISRVVREALERITLAQMTQPEIHFVDIGEITSRRQRTLAHVGF